jgi:hypothetical protein
MQEVPTTGSTGDLLGVWIEDLWAAGARAASLAEGVEGIDAAGSLAAVDVDAGSALLAGEIQEFARRWAYGLRCLHTDLLRLGRALNQAAGAYQKVEAAIVKAEP